MLPRKRNGWTGAPTASSSAATDVDPDTGLRDLHVPQTLMRTFGHTDCGIYGEVMAAGPIAVGDAIREAGEAAAAG